MNKLAAPYDAPSADAVVVVGALPQPALSSIPLPSRLRFIPPVACICVLAVAATAALGWFADIEALRTIQSHGSVAINPLTAICISLLAGGLWFRRNINAPSRQRAAAAVLCASAILLAAVRTLDYLGLTHIALDELLFPQRLNGNIMAPNTAFAILALGIGLLMFDVKTPLGVHPAQLFILSALAVTLLALAGYLYRAENLKGVPDFIPMSLNAGISFCLLAAGALCARPERQPVRVIRSDSAGGAMARRMLPTAIALPALVGWLGLAGLHREWFSVEFALSLLVLCVIVTFGSLTWWNARMLHLADRRHRAAELALRESEAFYVSLVESLPQNIIRKDASGRIIFANQNFCRTIGKTREEVVNRSDLDLFPHPLAEKYRRDDLEVMRTGKIFDIVEEHVTSEGESLYVQVIKTPLIDERKRVLGIQIIFWDVSERVHAEETLNEKNRLLVETAQSERSAHEALKSAQAAMVQTEKLASLGQMVAGVAHEINNPLAFVINNVAVLGRDIKAVCGLLRLYESGRAGLADAPLAAQVEEMRGQIDLDYTLPNLEELVARSREGLKRISQIVNDLRDFARLDESDLHEVDVNAGIESTVNIVRALAKKKSVRIELDLQALPPVACFPAKLNQVVMNLITNAIDACPPGGRVGVTTRQLPSGVAIEVADNGHGIPPEIRGRIFDPFFTTKAPGHGTGLGLSISYGIVQAHNGAIEVESAVGEGTRFCVTLPMRPNAPTPPRASAPATPTFII